MWMLVNLESQINQVCNAIRYASHMTEREYFDEKYGGQNETMPGKFPNRILNQAFRI